MSLMTRLTCNWFVIGLQCATRGHQWREEYAGCCVKVKACAWCGQYRGAHYSRECSGRIRWKTGDPA